MLARGPRWLVAWSLVVAAVGALTVATHDRDAPALAISTTSGGPAVARAPGAPSADPEDEATTSSSEAAPPSDPERPSAPGSSTTVARRSTTTTARAAAGSASSSPSSTSPPVQGEWPTPPLGGPLPEGAVPPPDTRPDVQGRVVDTDGHPVPFTCVFLGPGPFIKTDADGYFVAQHVQEVFGGMRLAVVNDDCRTDAGPYWVSNGLTIHGVPSTVLLVAHRSGGLSGRLVGPLGTPIAGACILAWHHVGDYTVAEAARTAFDGSWHVDRLVAGDYTVGARPDCNSGHRWYEGADRSWETTEYHVALGSVTPVPTLVATTEVVCPDEGTCEPHPLTL